MKRTLLAAAALCAAAWAHAAEPVKIGFLVKQVEEPWFQEEWRYAEVAAKEKGFTLVKIGIPNGEKTMAAIDNLAAQKAQGFVICAPDVKLGKAIERAARRNNLKVVSVDDRLVDGSGKPIASIPHMGISGYQIGKQVGEGIVAEIKARKWNMAEVGAIRVAYDQLPTGKDRTTGAIDALKAAGFPAANIIDAPQAKTDTENAFNAANIALTKNAKFKYWVAVGLNDEAVLGAVRAAEGRGIKADNMIGIGIGGAKAAESELNKPQPTGFFGSIMISAKEHGYQTSINLVNWINGKGVPPAEVLTKGMLMTRANQAQVRKAMGQ
ncbi:MULTISPECIES: arabinose ABC transporter substrate-binding protein [unclassified Duganella]|uniref:arabinose ABC transporter substrate-binding protein n=1 Tax=unclassified Duganella TaxID=2636909 RepID=UPI000887BC25|nr:MULTISPECIES: arabinose ABC transporter substrate-binding protein [unclassified Duganella]SDF97702.1 L-arabinose-binding protein [Duganella sp. OV458]SDJ06967.1 L-arabinose-binding protein [Duganella sp. OV510]